MRKALIGALLGTALFGMGVSVVTAQEHDALHEDLALLASSMARLADTFERQERAREAVGGFERLRVLVSLLEIRTQKHEALQRELRQHEDKEQQALEAIAGNRSRLERLEEMVKDPEVLKTEGLASDLERQRGELEIRIAALETRMQYASQRQVDLQNRIADEDRLVRELDGLVDSWLSETDFKPGRP